MQGATYPGLSDLGNMGSHPRRARRRAQRAGWVVAALIVSGCAGEEPVPEPTTPVVTTTAEPEPVETLDPEPEPQPEPTGLTRPEAMDRNDDEGAIAAAEYYTLLAYEALRTSVTTEWETVGAESCEFCANLTADVRAGIEEGARFEGGEVELQGPGRIIGREDTLHVTGVDVPVRIGEQTKIDARGNVEQTWPSSDHYLYLELAHGYEGWVVMTAHSHAVGY